MQEVPWSVPEEIFFTHAYLQKDLAMEHCHPIINYRSKSQICITWGGGGGKSEIVVINYDRFLGQHEKTESWPSTGRTVFSAHTVRGSLSPPGKWGICQGKKLAVTLYMDMVRGLGIFKLLRLYPMFLSCGHSFLKLFAQAKTVSIDIPFCVDPGDWPRSSLVSESCFTTEAFYQSTWTRFFLLPLPHFGKH